ncbi:MAG: hypothetical protein J1E38_04625 [Paramuribaculum sp.]|nr:hypothetical protein [Paramuribaculum sp.]
MKKIISFLIILSCFSMGIGVFAQTQQSIKWSQNIEMQSNDKGVLILTAHIQPGWHLYGMDMPEFGPRPTEIDLSSSKNVIFSDPITDKEPLKVHDEMFDLDLTWWDSDVQFSIPFTLINDNPSDGPVIQGVITFMGCDNKTCLPPQTFKFAQNAFF